jgi:hypothetical protein
MSIILIVIYCLMAVSLIFGLTFHNEMLDERRRQQKIAHTLPVIQGGKRIISRQRRHL